MRTIQLYASRGIHAENRLAPVYKDPLYRLFRKIVLGNFSSERNDIFYNRSEDNLYLMTRDGQRVGAYLVKPPSFTTSTRFFVICHGKGCDRHSSANLGRLKKLSKLNACFLVVDYRGFGDSTGEFTMDGANLDLDAAFEYIRKTYNPASIFLVGHSMGSAIALEYCRYLKQKSPEKLPAKVFCLATFSTTVDACKGFFLYKVVRIILPYIERNLMLDLNYDNVRNSKEIRDRLVLIHGTRDQLIPISHSIKLSRESNVKLIVTGHDHISVFGDIHVWNLIFSMCEEAP